MAKSESSNDAEQMLRRIEAMGIEAELMEDGRCVLAKMRLSDTPFRSINGSLRIGQLTFSTLGRDRIKCLDPPALFQLPIIRILDCRDSTDIEARIRLAWQRHTAGLEDTHSWLSAIGARPISSQDGAQLSVSLAGDSDPSRTAILDRRTAILPGQGALSGIALQRGEDRILGIDPAVWSSVDLDIAISTRKDELRRLHARLGDTRRMAIDLEAVEAPTRATERPSRVLLAGPTIARKQSYIEALRLRGYAVELAANEAEALAVFDHCSPELVIADVDMGRNSGAEFIVSLRGVTGVEEIPVVLVDQMRHEQRREAARRVGAAGYLVYPIEIGQLAAHLARMINEPRRRRYTRYHRKLPVEINGAPEPGIVTSLGRGGMFVATDQGFSQYSLQRCRLSLPELGTTVSLHAEVLYRREHAGRSRGGVGVRFCAFEDQSENRLIDYLRTIDPSMSGSARL